MLRTYNESVFVPYIVYGVVALCDLLRVRNIRKLHSIQTYMLLRVTKAYRIPSTKSLQMVAGELPLHLLLFQRHYLRKELYLYKNRGILEWVWWIFGIAGVAPRQLN